MIDAPNDAPLDPTAAGGAGEPRRVLIVDDNQDLAEPIAMLLELHGYDARYECDPLRALALARQFEPQIALIDIGLPGIDGYELASRMRAQPATARCRLIALSGHGPDDDPQRAAAAGFERHLVKPVELDTLLQAIRGGAR